MRIAWTVLRHLWRETTRIVSHGFPAPTPAEAARYVLARSRERGNRDLRFTGATPGTTLVVCLMDGARYRIERDGTLRNAYGSTLGRFTDA